MSSIPVKPLNYQKLWGFQWMDPLLNAKYFFHVMIPRMNKWDGWFIYWLIWFYLFSRPWYKDDLCALAFKVLHDKQRGPLVFLRIYSGTMKPQSAVYNINKNCTWVKKKWVGGEKRQMSLNKWESLRDWSLTRANHCRERMSRLLLPFADQQIEISSLSAGNIALTVGLKQVKKTKNPPVIFQALYFVKKKKLPQD